MPVSLEEMSEPLIQAVLATEDRRFYEHNGVDFRRIGAAMVANLRRGRIVQGASTITQQFVRGAVLDRTKTYSRKFREAWLSHRLEEKFGKHGDPAGVSQPRLFRRWQLRRRRRPRSATSASPRRSSTPPKARRWRR